MKKYIAEFIGTFFLVTAIAFTANPIAIGVMLMVMIYAAGHISGAHFNPAVTFGLWAVRKIEVTDAVFYWTAQILGAFVAALFYHLTTGNSFVPAPGGNVPLMKAVLVEAVFTFALVYVISSVAVDKKNQPNNYFGLAIGFTIMAGAFCGGSISGGAFNPAVAVGPMLADVMIGGGNGFSNVEIYLLGPLVGGVAGAWVYDYMKAGE